MALYTSVVWAHVPDVYYPNVSSGTVTGTSILKASDKNSIRYSNLVANASPTITSFSPSSGPVGTSVTISGTNFNSTKGGNMVFFGATRATVTDATESSLTVTVPIGATFQPISVLNSNTQLTGYSAMPFIVTFSPNNSTITKANFSSQQDLYPASTSTAQYMVTSDLDGDGKADVVSVNSDPVTNTVTIFRNIANSGTITSASFADKIERLIDGAPAGLAVSDLDGDGKPELVVLDASGKVSIFLNTSTSGVISFAPKVDYSMLNGISITVGDLDNDGRPEVVVSNRKDGKVFVFRNTSTTGNISFVNAIAAATFTTGGPENVAIGDLNGDGKADMTVANKVSGLVAVFPNISTTGHIGFGTAISLIPGTKPVKAALGDFNADGKPDLAVANSTSSTVSVFENTSSNGTISFAAKVDLAADTKVTTAAITDLDGDGKLDIVTVAVNSNGRVSVFRNTYTSGAISVASFEAKSLLTEVFQDVTIGDIDGDGRPDLAGTNLKIVSIFRYNPFTTKVSASLSDKTLAGIDSEITADPVPSATGYRFRVTQGANVQTIDVQTNSFKLTELASYAYSTSYSIDVQVQVGGSWSDYGTISVLNTPGPLTQISEVFRGKMLESIDDPITADPLPLATGYRFRVIQGVNMQSLDAQTNSFRLTQLANYDYSSSYTIDVQAQVGGIWGNYGAAYVVNSEAPMTQISESFSGKILANTDSVITADPVPLATGYRFRVTEGAAVQTLDAQTNSFKLIQLPNYAYNTKYSMDVAVKTGATLNAFGAAILVTTPAVPVTQMSAVFCGAVLTDLDGGVRADALPLATAYRFRVKRGNSPAQIIEEAVAQTLLYKTTFYAYNTTYTVDVSANVNGIWSEYGTACDVTTLPAPLTQVSLINCGKLLTTNDSQISIDNVPTATAYRLKITTNNQTDYLDVPTNFARLAAMASYEFNTIYSIQVAALVNEVWTPYGPSCNVTTPVLVPQISTEMCGTVLKTIDGEIHQDLIPATSFRFKVTQGVNTITLESNVGSIRLSSVPFYAYNTVYSVEVAVERNGRWTAFGPACNVTTLATPVTQLALNVCGTVLNTTGDVHADNVPTASAYRFRVKEGSNEQILNSPTAFAKLISLPVYAFNTIYTIDVSAYVAGNWTPYGATCTITTAAPLTNANLSALTLSTGTLTPVFDTGTLEYTAAVRNATSSITLSPRVSDNTATVKVSDKSVTSGSASENISLSVGVNPITTVVTAQDGTTTKSYTVTITRDKAAQLITFNTLTAKTYGNLDFDPGATSNNTAIPVTYTSMNPAVATVVGGQIHIVGAGTSIIRASQVGDLTHYAATDVQQTLTVNPYAITVTAAAKSKTYGDADPVLTYTFAPALVTGDSFSGSLTRVPGENVGTYAINQGTLALNGNYMLTYVGADLTIGAKTITVTAAAKSKTFGDADPALTYTFDPALQTGDAFTGGLTRLPGENVGTYTISQGTLALSGNYILTYVGADLTIGSKTITVTAAAKSKTYGDADPTLTYTFSPALQTGDAFTGGLTRLPGENVGTYAINKGTLALNGNYTLTYVGDDLTIGSKTITLAAAAKSKTFGDADPALTYTFAPALQTGDAFTGSLTRQPGENVGTYSINQGTLALSSNYTLTYVGADLTIGLKTITVTAAAKSKTFGDADPSLNYTFSPALQTGDAFTGSPTRAAGENVGTYGINQGTLALSNNYSLTYVGADLTIGQKTITVTAAAKSKTYGAADPALTYTFDPALQTGDVFTGSLTRQPGENVGTYAINQGTLALSSNYTLTYVGADLTIGSKTITVTAAAKSKTFGAADPSLTYTFSPALQTSDAFTGSPTRAAGENVGTYGINQGTLTLSNNYSLTYVGADLTIGQKTITVTAAAKSKTFGAVDPALTYTFSPALQTGDTFIGNLTRQPGENVGTYAINQGTLALNGNYTLTYVNGTLTINSTTQAITFGPLADKLSTDVPFTLGATASSGLVVSYTSSDATIARIISGNQVEILRSGTVNITANQIGNANYRGAVPVIQQLRVVNNPAPVLVINSSLGASISKGETTLLTASGANSYVWSNANGIISQQNSVVLTVRPSVTTTYTVTGTNQFGRTSTANFTLEVRSDFQALKATNVMTPNSDGVNDVWVVENIDLYPENQVTIIDRAGRAVLKVRGYKNNWDATLNGMPLDQGTYYYIIDFGKGFGIQKGFISVVRGR